MADKFFTGFFTRSAVKEKTKPKDSGLSDERLRELGLKGVDRMNPDARTRHMKPSGSARPDLYILGEAPGVQEDQQGAPFVGPSGKLLRSCLADGGLRYRFHNVCRTMPLKRGKSNAPTHHEIECYRNSVEEDIAAAKPPAILATGHIPTQWCLSNEVGAISVCRGRRFPANIGGHLTWVYPVNHPAYILRVESAREYAQISGQEHRLYFERDIKRATDEIAAGLPKPRIEPTDLDSLMRGVIVENRSLSRIQNFLAEMRDEKAVALDVEANRFRPYADGAKLLTLAIGTAKRVIAFPIDHPQATWSKDEKRRLHEITGNFLVSRVPKLAHNAPFDLEWLLWRWGDGVCWESMWHDTMGEAYNLDERQGGMSLNFLNILYFGLKLKKQSIGRMLGSWMGLGTQEIGEIDRSRLEFTNVDDVCRYNGLDSKFTAKLHWRQKKLLIERGLWRSYLQWVGRVPTIAIAQRQGLPVSPTKNAEFYKKESEVILETRKEIKGLACVRKFESRFGEYKDSNQDNILMFRDLLGRKEGQRGNKYSADEEVLAEMKDEPLANLLLKVRKHQKLCGTYIEKLDRKHKESVVYPDGRIHCRFNHCKTDTKRLSSSEPNTQNFPSRTDAWVKEQIEAEPGKTCLFVDYGQQEARCIGMASQDKNLCKALWTEYDIHMDWAKRIYERWKKTFKERTQGLDEEAAWKKWRGDVKAQWVFAGFFNARPSSRAKYLDMPVEIAQDLDLEFWGQFQGVKKWQRGVIQTYREYGYVESLTGHRRHGPMNEAQIVNAGIQASGTDLTMDAMNRLARLAYETDRPWLYPNLQVHDDISWFDIPKKREDEAIQIIVTEMCRVPFPFVNVPIVVEVSRGANWGKKSKIGDFRSDKVIKQLEAYKDGGN